MKIVIFLALFLSTMGVYSKEIRVGVISGAPPFSSSYSTSKGIFFYGFSIDVMNAICNRIDVNCVYKTLSLTNQFQSLKEGSIDVLLLANPYEPEKLKQYAISLPYFISKVQFYANKNSTMNQLALVNLKIGVIATTFYNLLNQSPYREGNQIIPFTSIKDLISALKGGAVDVILLNTALATNYIDNGMYHIKAIGQEFDLGQGYGIIAKSNQKQLIQDINKAILMIQADGTYITILKRYFNNPKKRI